ncbi:MAG: chondroitinase-B domain-containing protein [Cyclobacteriaceae bacterium]
MRHKFNHSMPPIYSRFILVVLCTVWAQLAQAQTRYNVSSLTEFREAHDQATPGDTIIWVSGTYANVFMDITRDGLIIMAATNGGVVFNGASKVEIHSDDILFSGFQYIGGDINDDHVIRIWGSDVFITQINIQDYTSYKYLIIDEDSRRTTVSYSNFENRLNLDDQNILSILVDTEPGYHKVQYCSFKNFEGTGNDLGIEPVRIGVSTQAHLNSRSIVEYCYFTNCDGDGELISNKAAQNVMRYNTFVDNSKAELVLRHGDEAIVYGNFFINNMGGVRVREGSGHYIYNNYFEGLDKRAIYLQNDPSDPLSDIHIYHNTIINSREFILGGDGGNPPQNVTIANNIFTDPQDDLFEDATGNETWIGNISSGSLGINQPDGLLDADPLLAVNDSGYFQLENESPAINAAEGGYPEIPLFDGLDYDNELALDLMQQVRQAAIADRTIGAAEPSAIRVHPHATADNTGPDYFREEEVITSIVDTESVSSIYPNPGNNRLRVELSEQNANRIKYRVIGMDGRVRWDQDTSFSRQFDVDISTLSQGTYILELISYGTNGQVLHQESHSFIKTIR